MGFYDTHGPAPTRDDTPRLARWFADRPQLPYLLPFIAFVALMGPSQFGAWLGIDWKQLWFRYLPAVYTAKTLLAATLLYLFRRFYTPIRWSHLPLGFLVGLLGVPLWVCTEYLAQGAGIRHGPTGLDLFGSIRQLPTIYIPPIQIPDEHARWLFYLIRVGGPTLVVPVMEELFFRDFLMRALVRGARFEEVPVGTFTWLSLLGMAALFGINHVQWPSGVLYGLLMGILLIRTKSLGACIVAHGTTNLVLYAAYCIPFWDWQFM